tara:strand:+ start:47033 stop:48586 length:1554 start_codon:yes stop_codon:yes gene_type:complete
MRKLFYILIFIASSVGGFAQDTIVSVSQKGETGMINSGYIHRCRFTGFLNEDTRFRFPSINGSVLPSHKNCYIYIGKSLVSNNTSEFNQELNIFPTVDLLGSQFGKESIGSFRGSLGVGITFQANEKWQGRAIFNIGSSLQSENADPFNSILNNSFYRSSDSASALIFQPRARISYKPIRFIELQTGVDHHFIGEGNRSMLLSDFGAPRPFFRMSSEFWKIEFTNIYQLLHENVGGQRINKFAASHLLDFHVTRSWKIGVFESVVFAPQDTLLNRGFEVEYLNPFLFYRPTEYSIGSQDRLLIGLNTSYQFDNIMLYGQFVIDDFVLDELVNRTRWWANKYGGQFGIKSSSEIGYKEFRWLSEINFARPFTYSHLADVTVYGNQGMPLAHPLGANFVESFSEARFFFTERLSVGATFMFAQQGGQNANDSTSFGANIYTPYTKRPYEYGYKIGGDGKLNRMRATVELNYNVSQKLRINAFIKPGVEVRTLDNQPSVTLPFLFGGIRTQLWNERSFTF